MVVLMILIRSEQIAGHYRYLHPEYTWGIEELYIILDDPGRMYLDTYHDPEPPL